MKLCNIVAGVLILALIAVQEVSASSVEIKENEPVMEEPEEEYFEEQTDDNTVTATKTKNLKVTREEDLVNKRIFIGDSRTIGMCLAATDLSYTGDKTIKGTDENGDLWVARTGEGLSWMKENDNIESEIIEGTNIYILMGVNDCRFGNLWHLYREYLEEKDKAWSVLGANLIFVSVLPLADGVVCSTSNDDITGFNEYILENSDVDYLDIYSLIKTDAQFLQDGLHYTNDQYMEIYELLIR